MPWLAAGAVVGAVAGVAGSAIQADATKSAASGAINAQTAAEERARVALSPYNDAGQGAVEAVRGLSGANGPDAMSAALGSYQQSPGYQWQLGQGLRAVDAGAASQGILHSGATIKGEIGYAEGLAKQDFQTYYNNLFNLANLGENAAAKTGNNAVTTGQGIAGTDVSTGAALTSIYGNEAKGLTNTLNNYANNSIYQNGMLSLAGSGGSGGTATQLGSYY
jgi:hypothetical protein